MKNLKLFLLLIGLLTTQCYTIMAQSISERYTEIEDLRATKDAVIPGYLFDSIAIKYQDGIAGTGVKDGKYVGTSMSIEDKSATVNIGFKPLFKTVYFGMNVAGSTKENFVDVVKNGKYQQTLSFGGTINVFLSSARGSVYCFDRKYTHTRIDMLYHDYYENTKYDAKISADSAFIKEAIADARTYCERYCSDYQNKKCRDLPDMDAAFIRIVDRGEKALDTLKKMGLLPVHFDVDKCSSKDLDKMLSSGYTRFASLKQNRYVRDCEATYMSIPWTKFDIVWLTFKGNYNIAPQSVIDTSLAGADHYLYTYNSEYAKASVALNYSHVKNWGRQLQITLSPTFTFSTPRNFIEDNKIKITKQVAYTRIPGDTVLKSEFVSEGYERVAARVYPWSVELPLAMIWNKTNWGLDFAVRVGGNDPMGDNVGGRLGVYIPIDIKDKTPVWIEPMIRVGKLFEKSDMNFWKDNVVVGFNVSVALKQLIGAKS